ncbi:MAG TPA: S49 family peptidase [Burkholderiaceae bacterium]|nr:S49 family peptidase [Burkholderiaceae bacterium]
MSAVLEGALRSAVVRRRIIELADELDMQNAVRLDRELRCAIFDPSVDEIVLDIMSNGGILEIGQQLAEVVYAARSHKRIIGYTNSVALSTGYLLMAACTKAVVAPGGWVGAVGVAAGEIDPVLGRMIEAAPVYGTSSEVKARTLKLVPFDDEAKRAEIARLIDRDYSRLVAAIARYRGVSEDQVRRNYGDGACVPADEALQRGMIDRIATIPECGTFDWSAAPKLLAELQKGSI